MTELRPWMGFESLVDGLARLQAQAREAAIRSVDELLTGGEVETSIEVYLGPLGPIAHAQKETSC